MAETIERLRPAHVLVEGPADFTDRLGELALDHVFPIALFSHARDGSRTRMSTTAFTEWSPELVAVRAAATVGAEIRFIDLPVWHPEFDSPRDGHGPVAAALPGRLGLDTMSAVWDHVVESRAAALPTFELTTLLDEYFDTIRAGDATVSVRELHMAAWVRAARDRADGSGVVVVCGGWHRPAILAELADGPVTDGTWPTTPPPDAAVNVGSYLIPYSYRRLDVDTPWWYQTVWQTPATAAEIAAETIVRDLRAHGHHVSATNFIGFRAQLHGLAAMRGHASPTRIDVLDAAASTLVDEALASPLPWTLASHVPAAEPHPVIASCLSTMRGTRVGALHPDAPAPALVHHVEMLLDEFDLVPGTVDFDLTDARDRTRSRVLHQLRVLAVPGFERHSGPGTGSEVLSTERWVIADAGDRLPSLVEAAAQGHTLVDAAGAALESAMRDAASDVVHLAVVLFDAVLCGLDSTSDRSAAGAVASLTAAGDLADVGRLLRTAIDLWRHDSLFGSRGSRLLGTLVAAAASRVVALARGTRATASGADLPRIFAVAALADAMEHARDLLPVDPAAELAALARDRGAAVELRGAALGTSWNRTSPEYAAAWARSIPADRLGDWLCGLFVIAREQFLDTASSAAVLEAVDGVVRGLTEDEFLTALPALRQAFEFFPPRERRIVATRVAASPRHESIDHRADTLREGRRLDDRVDDALARIGLS
ncbi:DUF5682 family protein [Rhodococcus sp. BE178]|uniref:DUF5682 family protein n=1 Tax=Rhodococcus sp. BE178 TaxID=2817737 RepID=UPI003D1B2B7D